MTKRPPESLRVSRQASIPLLDDPNSSRRRPWQHRHLAISRLAAVDSVMLGYLLRSAARSTLRLGLGCVIRDFGIDHDVEILDADPDDGRAQSAEDDEGDES
ncbi:hypothetical protein FS749_008164 [Ceratobasidium sp. UAMH 11750]|nr:hypothetical protein FS749_008164 [Ceratobasidium sp. UAMH 11750]